MTQTILYVVDSLGLSGKTRALASLALNLDRSRHRGFVVTFAPPEGMLYEQLSAAGVPVEHIDCDDGLRPSTIPRLLRLVRQLRPAIVHCFNPRPMLYGGIAAAAVSRPAIGTLSAFACLDGDGEYAFLPQPLHTRSLRNRFRNHLLGRLMRRIAAVSARAAVAFSTANRIPRRKMCVIGYGVDVEGIERVTPEAIARLRAEVGARPGEVLLGSVGRLVEQKDYPTQLRALALAGRRQPLRMVVAGSGPLASQLRELARGLGIEQQVCWLGERADIPVVLRCVDAFVIASKFEPFGVSVLEAMAASLPIVATQVNEIPEILDGGNAGVLVPPEQPDALATALERISSDPELRVRLGARARSIAEQRYTLQAAVSAYVKLYDQVSAEGAS